jgi:NAD(P)-dependent dehydrogenase (short-subunit alcohol dehydrogenase family)
MYPLIHKLFDLSGKTAIVTGSGGGIGKAIAHALAGAGADIVIADVNTEKMKQAATELQDHFDTQVLAVATDVQQADQVQAMVDHTLTAFGLPSA